MPSAFLEIVQLPSGEIVLQRSDGEGEPLVTLEFSSESKAMINDACLDVAKVMIQAGIHAAATITGVEIHQESVGDMEAVIENFGEDFDDLVIEASTSTEDDADLFDDEHVTSKQVISRTLH